MKEEGKNETLSLRGEIGGKFEHALYDLSSEVYLYIRHGLSRLCFLFCHWFCGRHAIKHEAVYTGKQACSTSYPRGSFV